MIAPETRAGSAVALAVLGETDEDEQRRLGPEPSAGRGAAYLRRGRSDRYAAANRWPTDLNDLHLAELHERAAAADISGYRLLRRDELIERLGGSERSEETADRAAWPARRRGGGDPLGERAERGAGAESPACGGARRRRRDEASTDDADTDEMVVVEAKVLDDAATRRGGRGGTGDRGRRRGARADPPALRLPAPRGARARPMATSTSPPPRCAAASCAPATRSRARRASHGAASATARSSTSTPSTARSRRASARIEFDALPAVQPERRIPLDGAADDVLVRAVDLLRRSPTASGSWSARPLAPGARRCCARWPAPPPARYGAGDRAADRRAPRGGHGLARGAPGRRVRDRDRGPGAGRAGADRRARARARPPARRVGHRRDPDLRFALAPRLRGRRRRRGQAPVRLRPQPLRRRLADRRGDRPRGRPRRGGGRAGRADHREPAGRRSTPSWRRPA